MRRAPVAAGPRRIALVTSGLDVGGGVPNLALWLRRSLLARGGYSVDLHDIATSRSDPASRRLLAPASWWRHSLRTERERPVGHLHWGATCAEVEPLRYGPRRELTAALRGYDLIQVVAGTPALAAVAVRADRPVVLQVASRVRWERAVRPADPAVPLRRSAGRAPGRLWRSGMTVATGWLEDRTLRAVDAVLAENDQMVEYVRRRGQPAVRLAPPGIDVDVFSPGDGGWQRAGPVLSVCRLNDPRKGLDRLVRAYARLRETTATAPPLVLAGHGCPPPELLRLVGALGLTGCVTIRSDVRPDELVELYRAASIFVQTSYEEGFGLSVMEAMACGLPVVSTDTAGSRELVRDGSTGWLVPGDPGRDVSGMVADRVTHLLDGAGAAFGRRGRQRCVTELSTRRALERFCATYDHLLGPPGGGDGRTGYAVPAPAPVSNRAG